MRKTNEIAYDSNALIMQTFVEIGTAILTTKSNRPAPTSVFGSYATIEIQDEGRTIRKDEGRGLGTQAGCMENNVKMNKYEIDSTQKPRPIDFLSYLGDFWPHDGGSWEDGGEGEGTET